MDRRQFMLSAVSASVAVAAPAAVNAVISSAAPAAPIGPALSPTGMWQDLARTIPATKAGDPVAVLDGFMNINGHPIRMIQPAMSARPTLAFSDGKPYPAFDDVDDFLQADSDDPLFKAVPSLGTFRGYPAGKVFEVRTSADTSRDALLRNEDEMMRKWGIKK